MTPDSAPAPHDDTVASDHDRLTRFMLDEAGVRGVHVSLGDTWRHIRSRDDYPTPAADLLGQATVAAALFTGHTKVDGRLSVQLRGTRALRTLFAECTGAGTLRAIARLAEDDDTPVSLDPRDLGRDAVLAITIENPSTGGRDPSRYQGIVSLERDTLSGSFEQYFVQSEQLPTRLLLAASGDTAAGLMLQKLPGDEGDADGWRRAGALFDTLSAAELLATPANRLLSRLFHEESPAVLGDRPLGFACSCSRQRVAGVLTSLGQDEARAAVIGDRATVRCEFCGETYLFTGPEIDALFTDVRRQMAAPDRVQ